VVAGDPAARYDFERSACEIFALRPCDPLRVCTRMIVHVRPRPRRALNYRVRANKLSFSGTPGAVLRMARLARLALASSSIALALAGCRDPEPADEAPMASGFASEGSGQATQGSADGTSPTSAGPADSGEPWDGTAYVGEIVGVLTVTFTPAHALVDHDVVGLAGAYRNAEVGWDGTVDLYSPIAYLLAFPAPPDDLDTLVPAQPVPVFDWGDEDDWLTAGNGMKLRQGEGGPELLACLIATGNQGQYPVYRSSAAMGVPAACNPTATAWSGATDYDVVLYGGDLFVDNVLLERVTTPPDLVVTTPDLAAFEAPLPADEDLVVAWEPGDDPDARVVIRVVDADTNVITVSAADDGEFTIPAAELGALTLGPLDLVVARERTDRVQFTDGGLTVLTRFERWGFFDLF
jgi:hypothetical protein